MAYGIEQCVRIAINRDEFVEYVRENFVSQARSSAAASIHTFTIPKPSFTAFRLIYASPVEISQSSRTVLLGGVPNLWYVQHENNVLRSIYSFAYTKLRRRVHKVNRYVSTMSSSYREADDSNHRAPVDDAQKLPLRSRKLRNRSEEAAEAMNDVNMSPPAPLASQGSQGSHDRLRKRTKTMACTSELMEGSNRGNMRLRDRNTISFGLNPREAHPTEIDSITTGCIDEADETEEYDSDENSCQFHTTDDETSSLLTVEPETISPISPQTIINLSPQNGIKNSPEVLEMPALKFAKSSKSTVRFKDNLESAPALSVGSSTFPLPSHSDHSCDEIDTFESSLLQLPTVDLKPTATSHEATRLTLMKPDPRKLEAQELEMISKLESRHRVLKEVHTVFSKTGRKLRLGRVHKDVSRAIDYDFNLSQKFFKKYKAGEIVKIERMLVMVKSAVNARESPLSFSEAEPVDTRVLERWKEYIVVARTTGNSRAPVYMQFYHTRNIPKQKASCQSSKEYSANSMDFLLDRSCIVGFYSTLDKTIHILKSSHRKVESRNGSIEEEEKFPFKVYILRCCTTLSAGSWMSFLQKSIGQKPEVKKISIHLPEVDATLSLPLTPEVRKELDRKADQESDELEVVFLPRGYKVMLFPLLRYFEIVVREKMIESGFSDQVREWEHANILMGLCWKHYDRLEWCFGDQYDLLLGTFALNASHLLEYRPLTHYPRSAQLEDGQISIEPAPIEGFLVRCTNRYGQEKSGLFKKNYSRFCYFFCCDGLLFFMRAFKSFPPLPENGLDAYEDCVNDTEKLSKLLKTIPPVFEQNPYQLDLDSHIEWLNTHLTPKEFKRRDNYAFACMRRRIAQVIKAEGVIDLRNVRSVFKVDEKDLIDSEVRYTVLNNANNFIWKTNKSVTETVRSTFVIEMKNGTVMKLLAPSPQIADEWVQRLTRLSQHWSARRKQDLQTMWDVKVANLRNLKIDESEESNISEDTPKWITDRGVANDKIFNVTAHAMLRPLIHSGMLYQKPRKHSVFEKYFVVLSPGFLILYECLSRKISGYKHYLTVPIEECYVYSGSTTSMDLLKRDKRFDHLNPDTESLPRAYSDGWKSGEDEPSRCFTLWFGTKRAISNYAGLTKRTANRRNGAGVGRNVPQSDETILEQLPAQIDDNFEKNPGLFRVVSRLGVTGRSMVFMARSRQERDQWVVRIYAELERLKESSDYIEKL